MASSGIFLGVSVFVALMLIPSWWTDKAYNAIIDWDMIALSLIILFFGLFLFGLGYAIDTIAENSLLNKQLKERGLLFD